MFQTRPGCEQIRAVSLLIFPSVFFIFFVWFKQRQGGDSAKIPLSSSDFDFLGKWGPSAFRLARNIKIIFLFFLKWLQYSSGKPSRGGGGCSRSFTVSADRFPRRLSSTAQEMLPLQTSCIYCLSLVLFSHCVYVSVLISCCFLSLSLSFRSFVTAGSLILTDRWWHCRKEEGFYIICWRGHTLGTLSRQQKCDAQSVLAIDDVDLWVVDELQFIYRFNPGNNPQKIEYRSQKSGVYNYNQVKIINPTLFSLPWLFSRAMWDLNEFTLL